MGIRPDKDPNAPENQPRLCKLLGHKWDWSERSERGRWYKQCDRCSVFSNGMHSPPQKPDSTSAWCPGPQGL